MRSSCAEWSARALERPCLDGTVELDLQFVDAAKRDLKFVFRRRDPSLQLLEAVGTFRLATIAVRRRPVGSGRWRGGLGRAIRRGHLRRLYEDDRGPCPEVDR